MDPLVLNAMIPGTSVYEDSANISSKSTPAGMNWTGPQIRWAYLQEFSESKTFESQTPKTAVNFLDFRDVVDVVSGQQRLKAYQSGAADSAGWITGVSAMQAKAGRA
ncbi:MAG: hypothetical protein Q9173_003274 [Seirophora scorigena]